MKRPVYEIKVEGLNSTVRKNSWNSAIKSMAGLVRATLVPGETATRDAGELVKRDKWTHESGLFVWTVSSGREIRATVRMLSPAS
jgi:hypothetical protein